MTSELFVVSVLRNSAWIDVAEFADEDVAFRVCDELRAVEFEAHVTRLRCISANPFALPVLARQSLRRGRATR